MTSRPANPIGRRACLVAVGAAPLALLASRPSQAQFQREPLSWPSGRAPQLDALDVQGRRWNTAALQGKAVLLNFWATWCAPCKEEMPTLQTLHDLADPHLVVLTVNVREPAPRVARYMQTAGLSLPVLLDPEGALAKAWGVKVYPSTVLMDVRGRPRERVTGAVDWTGGEAQRWMAALR